MQEVVEKDVVGHKILREAFKLFMKYGIRSVSMDDLSRHLGISKKTVYQHIDSKDDLIAQVVDSHLAEEEGTAMELFDTTLHAIDFIIKITAHELDFFRNMAPSMLYDLQKYYPEHWRKITKNHQTFVQDIIKKNIQRGIDQGLYRPELNPDILSRLYVEMSFSIMNEEVFPQEQYEKAILFKEVINYHMRSIVTPVGLKLIEALDPL